VEVVELIFMMILNLDGEIGQMLLLDGTLMIGQEILMELVQVQQVHVQELLVRLAILMQELRILYGIYT